MERINRDCPLCRSQVSQPFAEERLDIKEFDAYTYASRKQPEFMCLRLVICSVCDLVYAPSPPAEEFLSTAYSEASYDSGEEASFAAQSYAKALVHHLPDSSLRNAAVDVGAGSGPLLPLLKAQGFDPVIGVEPSLTAIKAAPPEVSKMLKQGMFTQALLGDLSLSLVCSMMTLEHISDPVDLVSSVFDALEPGGLIVIVVHDWRAPLNRLLGSRSPIIDVEHLQLFSPKSIDRLLKSSGFGEIQQRTISNTYPLSYWVKLAPLPVGFKLKLEKVLNVIRLSKIPVPMRVGNRIAIGTKPREKNL